MSVDTATINDADDWRDLSPDEQREVLDVGWEETDTDEAGVRDWDRIDDATQQDTLDAIQQSLDETWTAHAFEGIEDETTVPFEMRKMNDDQQSELEDRAQLLAQVDAAGEKEGVENADDLKAELGDDAAELFESLGELESWLNDFLDDATAGDRFVSEWWADGTNYPGGLRLELFFEVFARYSDRLETAQSFRTER